VIAHIGALPLEELLPAVAGAGSGLAAVRAWIAVHARRRRSPVRDRQDHAAD
jgi:hypothetical protein